MSSDEEYPIHIKEREIKQKQPDSWSPGDKFKWGFIAWDGMPILNKCPCCGYENTATEAVKGMCGDCYFVISPDWVE